MMTAVKSPEKSVTPVSAGPFNIGQAASQSGVSAKMVRHYESLGLLPTVHRTDAGYRQYGEKEVHTLRFIRRARLLGFSMAEIGELLKLWQNKQRASADVKRIAQAHVADLERRIAEMEAMRQTLQQLAHCCAGDDRPDCPILSGLAG
ncbi:MerR family copper efflux transcriptional regulator [Polaromonas sp. CG_9.5]|uniref:Cu(I)-responsive transcriptional regulator n=1 Tax=Polaromonas sp. CG_9.5 TaxID=3071705 RepID=UPI002DFE499F|nr:MerR family copper efflux transcriptional regulator [Polaromonas sp. CG_9.5]